MAEILTHVVCWDYKFVKRNWRGKVEKEHETLSSNARIEQLETKAREGFTALSQWVSKLGPPPKDAGIANPNHPLVVFVAPEWLFTYKRNPTGKTPSDEDYYLREDRNRYEAACRRLAAPIADQHTLVVAGSMLWIEPRSREAKEELKRRSLDYVVKRMSKRRSVPLAVQPAFAQWTGILGDVGADQKAYLAFNEAFLCFDGEVKKSIRKSEYGGDFPIHDHQMLLVPGIGAGTKTVTVAGKKVKVGVGICIDAKRVRAYNGEVDLYILVSQTISAELIPAGTVRPGGLTIQADGTDPSRLIQGLGGGKADLGPAKKMALETQVEGDFVLGRALVTVPD